MQPARPQEIPIVRVIVLSILFVAAVVGLLVALDAQDYLVGFLRWLDAQGPRAPILFMVAMALAVVFLVPGIVFTTGAGFVFGVVNGTLYVVVGTTAGAVMAFLIARYLFGDRAARYVETHAGRRFVTAEIARHGLQIVLLTRVVPFFPFKLSNYLFGLTPVSLRAFTGGTFVGIIPFSLHNTYLGAMAADVAMVGVRETERSGIDWALYGLGLVAIIVLVVYLNRLARRTLAAYTAQEKDEPTGEAP